MADPAPQARGFTIARTFDAPRERVFRAWTQPAQFAQWFGGPDSSVPLETLAMDVRPGGAWNLIMLAGPERMELAFGGFYREVVEPERLVLVLTNPEDPSDPNVEVMTVVFTDLGDKTEILFTQTGHLPEEEYVHTKQGTEIFFDSLAELVAREPA
jgi:uncharacterized protein YndB with AHSA1/START domain